MLAVLIVLVLAPAGAAPGTVATLPAAGGPQAASFPPHAPIRIIGNANFSAANGVTGGTGAPSDPYVIEGWDINASTSWFGGVSIEQTTASFVVRNVTVHDTPGAGIYGSCIQLLSASNGLLEDFQVTNCMGAIFLSSVRGVSVVRANISYAYGVDAFHVAASRDVQIRNSTLSTQVNGALLLSGSTNVTFAGNRILGPSGFVSVDGSTRVALTEDGEIPGGLLLTGTEASHFSSLTVSGDTVAGKPLVYASGDAANPAYRLNGSAGFDAGELIVANFTSVAISSLTMEGAGFRAPGLTVAAASDVVVEGSILSGFADAITVRGSSGVRVQANGLAGNGRGVVLANVTGGLVAGNRIEETGFLWSRGGIDVTGSPAVDIRDNTLTWTIPMGFTGVDGIVVGDSPGATIAANRVTSFRRGISLWDSDRANVSSNDLVGSGEAGVFLFTTNATLGHNTFTRDGIEVAAPLFLIDYFDALGYYSHTIDGTNLVNGFPVRYEHDGSGVHIGGGTLGQLIVARCTDVTVDGVGIEGTQSGIALIGVDRATVTGSEVSDSSVGIALTDSSNLTVSGNRLSNDTTGVLVLGGHDLTLAGNNLTVGAGTGMDVAITNGPVTVQGNWIGGDGNGVGLVLGAGHVLVIDNTISGNALGIEVAGSTNVTVYHNNFVNNRVQAEVWYSSDLSWDNGYPSGGNYWSDYNGSDRCSGPDQTSCSGGDGIGDMPYTSAHGDTPVTDRYPLLALFVRPASGLSVYVLAGIGAAIAGAVAAAAFLLWRRRQRRPSAVSRLDSEPPVRDSPKG